MNKPGSNSGRPDGPWPRGVLFTGAAVLGPEPLPMGTAVGMVGERLTAVGPQAVVAPSLPDDHEVVDLTGKTLSPGFIDAHTHPLPSAFFAHNLDVTACETLAELFDQIRERARTTPPGQAVFGYGLEAHRVADGRLPTRAELDRLAGDAPVVLLAQDGHHALGSSAALARAGFHEGSADPAGGRLQRDASGRLTGLCGEAAASTLLGIVEVPEWDELAAGLDRWAQRLVRAGVTGLSAIVQTGAEGPAGPAGELEVEAWSVLAEQLAFDIQTIIIAEDTSLLRELRATGLHAPDQGRRLDGFKIFLDGTLGGRTACLHRPYSDAPDTAGMLTIETGAAWRRMVDAHLAGLSVCVHAIGDRATRQAADMFARLLAEHPTADHRHRVEHASVAEPATVEALAVAGVAAVVQPMFLASEHRWLASRLGPDRLANTYPFRRLLDAGVTVGSSSDSPIEAVEVLPALHAAVDRMGVAPEQAISPIEALTMATLGSSTVRGTEADVGRLAAGMRADLVVLGGEPLERLDTATVDAVVINGAVHHDPAGLLASSAVENDQAHA